MNYYYCTLVVLFCSLMMIQNVHSNSEMDISDDDIFEFDLDLFSSTPYNPQTPNDSSNTWLQNVIDSIGLIGLISVGTSMLLCLCCLCIGCACYLRMRNRGSSSVYQYYSDIEV